MPSSVTTSFDPFEQQRLLLALTVLTAFVNGESAPAPTTPVRAKAGSSSAAHRPANGRRHVRPARSC